MAKLNLTVIGGGSVNWMRGLMRDVYLIDEIEGGKIRLVDPYKEHVEAVAQMLFAFNKMRKKDYEVSIVEDRKGALEGADIVLSTFSPGRMDAFYNDLEIPIKYGIRLPVSMTVGTSGISASLRTAPVAYEIVEDMEDVCPGAWILNETNPMSVVTKAMNMAAKRTKVLGLCHGVHGLPGILGPALGLFMPESMDILTYLYSWLEEQGLDYTFAGLNHFIFLNKAVLHGEDVLPRIREYCRMNFGKGQKVEKEEGISTTAFESSHQAAMAICNQTGYFPINSDRHTIEFWPGLCNIRNGFGMKYGVKKTTVDARRFGKARQLEEIKKIARGEKLVSWTPSGEEVVQILRTIVSGGKMLTVVNIPNKGQISNLPDGCIVETLGNVTPEGIEPKPSGELPGVIGSWCRLHADIQHITLKAALEGSRELFIQALSLDPASGCADFSELPDLADELLIANKKWLPRFFD